MDVTRRRKRLHVSNLLVKLATDWLGDALSELPLSSRPRGEPPTEEEAEEEPSSPAEPKLDEEEEEEVKHSWELEFSLNTDTGLVLDGEPLHEPT